MENLFIRYTYVNELDTEDAIAPNVEELTGRIFLSVLDDTQMNETEVNLIGKIELHYYNNEFIQDGLSMFEAFDRSMHTITLGSHLVHPGVEDDPIKSEVTELIGDVYNYSILVINRFSLLPKYRGKGYGEKIIKGIENYFRGKCGIIALMSYPLQHDNMHRDTEYTKKLELSQLENDYRKAQIAVNTFYTDCGFKELAKNVFIKNIDPI